MKLRNIFKALFYWSIILFFGWLIYSNAGDYEKLLSTIQNADFTLLGWGILLTIGNLSIMTVIFQSCLSIFAQDVDLGSLLPQIISYSFMSISNPLGTTGATTYMVRRLSERGLSYLKSIFAFFASQLAVNLVFLGILAFSSSYLKSRGSLDTYEILASQLLIALNSIYVLSISVILILPKFSLKAAAFLARVSNIIAKFLFKRSIINPHKLSESISEIQKVSAKFGRSTIKFITTLILSLIYHAINIIVLYTSFYAFGNALSWEKLISIYSIITLFSIVSPTPQGIGIVEGLAQIGAVKLGVPSETALASILTFRATTIWLPALLGFIVFRRSKKLHTADSN